LHHVTLHSFPTRRSSDLAYSKYEHMLFLGRLELFPIAMEGALKLKEISYIHAEAYPAAEMKHGPIAMVSPDCPAVFLVPKIELLDRKSTRLNSSHVKISY